MKVIFGGIIRFSSNIPWTYKIKHPDVQILNCWRILVQTVELHFFSVENQQVRFCHQGIHTMDPQKNWVIKIPSPISLSIETIDS